MTSLSKSAQKRIIDSLGVMALVSWLGFICVRYYYYARITPEKYDAATGHIFEVNNHGHIFYLDATQNLLTYIPLVVGVIFFFASLLLERRWKIYKEINELRLKPLKPY